MRGMLILAAVGETATGAALVLVPSLVGQLLLGVELTGVILTVARVAGIALIGLGGRVLAGTATNRYVDLQRGRHGVSRLRRCLGQLEWSTAMARGRPARDPDGTLGQGIHQPR